MHRPTATSQRTQFKLKKFTASLFAAIALLPLLIPPGALGVSAAFVPLGGPLWNGLWGYCPYQLSATVAQTNNELTVSWPGANLSTPWPSANLVLSTTSAVLQASSDLTATSMWTNVAAQRNAAGDTVTATVAGTNEAQFLRVDASPCCAIPIFQFAIFYDGLLEFTWAAPLTVRGRVHANSNILTGSSSDLIFGGTVTAAGDVLKRAWFTYSLSAMTGTVTYLSNPGFLTNTPVIKLPAGVDNPRAMLEMPPAGEAFASPLGQQRFYCKAELALLVSNTTVTAEIRSQGGFDPSPATITWFTTNEEYVTNIPYFLSITNIFFDQRESKMMNTTQIDVGKYTRWATTNSIIQAKLGQTFGTNNVPNILYVADFRTNSATTLSAVRLTNGVALPGRGLTIATPNPLYTLGIYNCPNPTALNTTDISQTQPAALISDALTILSASWRDPASSSILSFLKANNTTVNAAIITGTMYSGATNGTPYSGGVPNLARLLEDWGNGLTTKLTLNTSLVNLYQSVYATNGWQYPGVYYFAPIRDFNFNPSYTNLAKLPPGTPLVSIVPPGN